ncbi:type II secretion system protein M [Rhodobacteraceae bacterium LMO-12]|nr:type II secretion system protein M [Rhodobacteraceae bacterium LMO-JJ12]
MSLIDTLARRSPRERVLLGLLAGIVLPLALGLGVLLPLHQARQAAERALTEAQVLNAWVATRAGESAAIAPATREPRAVVAAPIGLAALEQSLTLAQLRGSISRLEARETGGIALSFDAVRFVDLMAWLEAQDPDWGYVITSAQIEPGRAPSLADVALELSGATAED